MKFSVMPHSIFQLLEDLKEQENKLENEIHRIQQEREAERLKLVEQLQEGK
jgi:transcription termination factor NusB